MVREAVSFHFHLVSSKSDDHRSPRERQTTIEVNDPSSNESLHVSVGFSELFVLDFLDHGRNNNAFVTSKLDSMSKIKP